MSRRPLPPFPPPPPLLPRPEHNPHERRSVTVTRAGLPADELREQHVVPRDSLFIDLVVWGRAARSPIWGPFQPFFAGLHVAVELCATPLTRERFNTAIGKALLLGAADKLMSDTRLFFLCTERPFELLEELADYLSPGPVAGSWCISLRAAGEAIIAVAPELPVQPGMSVLRLTAPKTSQAEHFQRRNDLLTDSTLSYKLKRNILKEERMLNRDRTDVSVVEEVDSEVDNLLVQFEIWKRKETKRLKAETMERGIERGIKRGIAQGKAEGKAEGVDKVMADLLLAAAPLLPPETIEALRKQRDPVAILAAVSGARK